MKMFKLQKISLLILLIGGFLVFFSPVFSQEKELYFETPYLSEKMEPIVELRQAPDIKTFQEKLEELIVSVFPSLAPPVISNVRVENITTNSATILWETNVKSSSIVAYASDREYDPKKENPYLIEVGNVEERVKEHKVELLNLNPRTLYHFQVKSAAVVGAVGKSQDFTFSTLASKIKLEFPRITNTEIEVRWMTEVETDSYVEYKDLKTGKTAEVRDPTRVKSHIIVLTNLSPDTSYQIRGFGYDANNILIESDLVTVKTKLDTTPPKISGIKIENALFPGRKDKALTIVSWRTDEPADSIVYFEKGIEIGGVLKNKAGKEKEFTLDHIVILVTETGTIYRLQIESNDEAGNKTQSGIRTILTPRGEESILDIIVKNFEETFKFLKRK